MGKGGLASSGWIRSRKELASVDASGAPIPRITYSALHVLEGTPRTARVFEYGSGYSTLWWATRSAEVVAVEHDEAWAEWVRARGPSALVLHEPRGSSYIEAPLEHGLFDVVVVDGRDRVRCSEVASTVLTPSGFILWDNSERERYQPGLNGLRALGFRSVDFWGPAPLSPYFSMTSILYRDGNCLGL
jgi:predicted O-methyltransferase YrrM